LKLVDLASQIQAELVGDGDVDILGIATLTDATKQHVSFFHNAKYLQDLKHTQAAAVIISQEHVDTCPVAALVVKDPYYAFAKLAENFVYHNQYAGVHPSAAVANTARLASSVTVAANAVIGEHVRLDEGVIIGPGVVIEDYAEVGRASEIKSNATIAHHVKIGERVIIHQNAVIGSDGFGNAMHEGRWHKVPQVGSVLIADDGESGANTTIDRGAINDTVIDTGARLDNLIQIGHNVKVGAHTAIAACSGIAGSTTIGKYCLLGGGVGVGGHIKIPDGTILTGSAQVANTIKEKGIYSSGDVIVPIEKWRKNLARLRNLDEILRKFSRKLKKLEAKIDE